MYVLLTCIVAVIAASAGGYYLYTKNQNGSSTTSPDTTVSGPISKPNDNETKPTTSSDVPKEDIPSSVDQSKDIQEYKLITENEKYKIRQLGDAYTITLYAIINNPSQYDMYRSQLKQYKEESLQYLKSTGVDTSKVKITYEPEEATNL